MATTGRVIGVAAAPGHGFSKAPRERIRLVQGIGVEGDAHAGASVKHRSRVKPGVFVPNLRQVHLIHIELLEELAIEGFDVAPGALGENITTAGLHLLGLPRGTELVIGEARVEITGLRNPCRQIEAFRPGLLARLARRRADGAIERLAGVMGVVLAGGEVRCGDAIAGSRLLQHLPGPVQSDSYGIARTRPGMRPVAAYAAILNHHPPLFRDALAVRNRLGARMGLKIYRKADLERRIDPDALHDVGGMIGRWTLYALDDHEIVTGADDAHLSFRVSLFSEGVDAGDGLVLSTAVQTHNTFGVAYLGLIRPAHRFGLAQLLTNAAAAGRI